MPVTISIKENSHLARLAAWKLNARSVAIVFGSTIHLWKVDKETFLQNRRWLAHEIEHIRQYQRLGFLGFLWQYIMESIRNGYQNNCFEVEARKAEDQAIPEDFLIL